MNKNKLCNLLLLIRFLNQFLDFHSVSPPSLCFSPDQIFLLQLHVELFLKQLLFWGFHALFALWVEESTVMIEEIQSEFNFSIHLRTKNIALLSLSFEFTLSTLSWTLKRAYLSPFMDFSQEAFSSSFWTPLWIFSTKLCKPKISCILTTHFSHFLT